MILVNIPGKDLARIRNEFMLKGPGKAASDYSTLSPGPYLNNRVEQAFCLGMRAALGHINECSRKRLGIEKKTWDSLVRTVSDSTDAVAVTVYEIEPPKGLRLCVFPKTKKAHVTPRKRTRLAAKTAKS